MGDDLTPRGGAKSQHFLLLVIVFLVYLGQMTMNPIIAPLAREVGLAEWQIGATISTGALMLVLVSQFWGRRSQSWGSKPVLIAALSLGMVTMSVFAFVAWLGVRGVIGGVTLFVLFLVFRGVGFGTAIAAAGPTAQSYIARVTTDEPARVRGMANVGAVQGIAMLTGAVVGGTLAGFGVLAPIVVIPVFLAIGLLLLVLVLRPEPRTELVVHPVRIRVADPRVWPYLLAGFGMFTSLGFIQVIAGFIVQDRFSLSTGVTGAVTGTVLLAAGLGMVVAQTLVVPRSGWSPPTLLRIGTSIATVGFIVLIPNIALWQVVLATLIIGFGLGIAVPGYTSGPTLLMSREEQGGLAGLVGATNGLTFVIAPTLSTVLYGWWAPLPVVAGAALMFLVAVFVRVHPRFRRPPRAREE